MILHDGLLYLLLILMNSFTHYHVVRASYLVYGACGNDEMMTVMQAKRMKP